ncbi:Unknown protein [Striga hermonthica]|uniref:Uncharacterized protein n=1 Tax=Striga hermonthica TaxID=68872 RepID=A0A9N7N9Q1_STRHE|nr:Unknown protein [Striga hermonthica]
MVGRRLTSLLKNRVGPVSTPAAAGEKEGQSWGRKIVSGALISLTGAVALSAVDDLLIFYGCSSKAMEKARDSWFSYLWPRDWEILIMEALLHVPANEKHNQTFRISVSDDSPPPPCKACPAACGPQQPVESVEKTRSQPVASVN